MAAAVSTIGIMTASSLDEEIPSPSRAILFALIGVVLLGLMVIAMTMLTQRNIPEPSGVSTQLEKDVAAAYGAEQVVYSNPATSTMTVTFQGRELKCTAPSQADIAARKPLQCVETVMLNAK